MRTLDPDKHAMQRQAFVAAAARCFARHGFHKTSTEAICAEAGTSSGKLFHYFPNKKAIILAVVKDQSVRHRAWMASLQQESGLIALEAFVDGVLDAVGDTGERALVLEIAAEGERDADVAVLGAADDWMLTEGLADILTQACAQAGSKPIIGIDHLVRLLMALVDGLFSRASSDSSFDPVAEREAIKTILRAILGMEIDNRHE